MFYATKTTSNISRNFPLALPRNRTPNWWHTLFVKCLNAFWDSLTFLITEPGLYLTQCTVELCFIPVMGGSNVSLTGDHEKLRVSEVILSLYQKLGVTGVNLCSSDVGLLKGHLSEPTRLLLIFVLLYYTIPTHPFIDLGKSQKISHFLYGK